MTKLRSSHDHSAVNRRSILFPDTMKQYGEYTIREVMHNAIAHQDYTLQQRIFFVMQIFQTFFGLTHNEYSVDFQQPIKITRTFCLRRKT